MDKRMIKTVFGMAAGFYWCASMSNSGAYFEPYLLIGLAGFLSSQYFLLKSPFADRKENRIPAGILSAFLSAAVLLANYSLFPVGGSGMYLLLCQLCSLALAFYGGYYLFYQIFQMISRKMQEPMGQVKKTDSQIPEWTFFLFWGVLCGEYLLFLFLVFYPGLYVNDTLTQITQIFSGVYTNHHPFYHTQLIRLCLALGDKLFGSINAGVAVYSILSVVFMSACFAYSAYSIHQLTGSKTAAIVTLVWYMVMPTHITYSFTVWKDTPFAGMVTLFVVSIYRLMKEVGKHRHADRIICFLSCVGVCLMRSNGFIAMASSLVLLLLFFRKEKRMLAFLAAALCIGFVLKYPVLKGLNVKQPDPIESLSIPVQQIGRTLAEEADLDPEQRALLEQIVDVDQVKKQYLGWLSDPLKDLVRQRNNQQYLVEHKLDYLKLYVSLGMQHPGSYIRAWVDQTAGFWNSGSSYWQWYNAETAPALTMKNDFGITPVVHCNLIRELYLRVVPVFSSRLLRPISSMGLYCWCLLFAMYGAWVRKDRKALFTGVLPTMIILTLLVAAPLSGEYRYFYGVVCAMPMVLVSCFFRKAET